MLTKTTLVIGLALIGRVAEAQQNTPPTSRTCLLTTGPRAGQRQDSLATAVPVGSACSDGAGSSGIAITNAAPGDAQPASTTASRTCRFTTGPRAGTTFYFLPSYFPQVQPAPRGTPCADGFGSTGQVVADPSAAEIAKLASSISHTCRFTAGARDGDRQFYSPKLYPLQPGVPVGAPCFDGLGDTGYAVADLKSDLDAPTPALVHTCKFVNGPRKGETQYYPPAMYPQAAPAPPGGPCGDGVGDFGYGVADPSAAQARTLQNRVARTCRFLVGPRTGQTQSFPVEQYPMVQPQMIGGPCNDGFGSVGYIIADP